MGLPKPPAWPLASVTAGAQTSQRGNGQGGAGKGPTPAARQGSGYCGSPEFRRGTPVQSIKQVSNYLNDNKNKNYLESIRNNTREVILGSFNAVGLGKSKQGDSGPRQVWRAHKPERAKQRIGFGVVFGH